MARRGRAWPRSTRPPSSPPDALRTEVRYELVEASPGPCPSPPPVPDPPGRLAGGPAGRERLAAEESEGGPPAVGVQAGLAVQANRGPSAIRRAADRAERRG